MSHHTLEGLLVGCWLLLLYSGWLATVVVGVPGIVLGFFRPRTGRRLGRLACAIGIAIAVLGPATAISEVIEDGSPVAVQYLIVGVLVACGPCLVTGGLAILIANARDRSRDRKSPRVCAACGYDLRGTTDPARCPECGTPFVPPNLPGATPEKAPNGGRDGSDESRR